MSRNVDYQFVSTDTNAFVAQLISVYELITESTVQPASPERLFIQWIANVIIQERVLNNYTGNQNIPSRSEGTNLDALAELFYIKTRPVAQAAICTERIHISEAQPSAILVPAGTRVTDKNNTLVWVTTADTYIDIGNTYADVMIQCQTVGRIGNGYAPGQIKTLIDVFPYYDQCENITESANGTDPLTDDEFYQLMRASEDAYSTAGPEDAYIYFAKQVSTEIVDVVANSLLPGYVNIYVLMADGTIAGEETKNAVYAACNKKFIRPLNDLVVIDDAEKVRYDIEFTYYIPRSSSLSTAEIEAAVNATVDQYVLWQSTKFGRDINPDYLRGLLMRTGIKRIDLTAPVYTPLRGGLDNTIPQVAELGTITVTNGGYEDD